MRAASARVVVRDAVTLADRAAHDALLLALADLLLALAGDDGIAHGAIDVAAERREQRTR